MKYTVAAAVLIAISSAAVAEDDGTIVGVITNSAKAPVAHATVTATRIGGGAIRSTISGSDGVYAFSDLPAGTWSITSEAQGATTVNVPQLVVQASKATRYDIVMASPDVPDSTVVAAAPAASPVTPPRVVYAVAHPMDDIFSGIKALVVPSDKKSIVVAQAAPAAAAPAAAPAPTVADALQLPDPAPANDTQTPFADIDSTWMNGSGRNQTPVFDTKFFTPEIRFDMNYLTDFNHPKDHTIDGSTEEFRSGEFQIEQVSFGGDFHWNNVKARFLSMLGLFSVTTPRNDASYGVGQWDLQGAYKYFSEANAGYHFDGIGHGLNVDLGIFVSYIGLFSYYNFDNWTYQPSFVSSNTPWFFNGLRIQYWPTQNLKIEPWLINGWQSYAMYNHHPGFGGQVLWFSSDSNVKLVFNTYTLGQDNIPGVSQLCNGTNLNAPSAALNVPSSQPNNVSTCAANAPYINYSHVQRIHEDDSLLVKYYDNHGQGGLISKAAFSLTADFGCEYGGGTSCDKGPAKEQFIGVMAYNRLWFNNNLYALTVGGGAYNNPGRYLALLPPINGATASSGTPYFTENPGQKLFQWDTQVNFQYMPNNWITWWAEGTFRHSDVPYWSGSGGITPPGASGGVQLGTAPGSEASNGNGGLWYPDLRTREVVAGAGVMVKF